MNNEYARNRLQYIGGFSYIFFQCDLLLEMELTSEFLCSYVGWSVCHSLFPAFQAPIGSLVDDKGNFRILLFEI